MIVMLFISTLAQADVHAVLHPRGEPEGLYLVTLTEPNQYGKDYRDFRLYCPTKMVREITNGKFKKARKLDDTIRLYGKEFYFEFKSVCKYKKILDPEDDDFISGDYPSVLYR